METETNTNDFTDILSAALDESGISGDFDDFNFNESNAPLPSSNFTGLGVSNPQNIINHKPQNNVNTAPSQADLFSQALKQLSSSPGQRSTVIHTSLPSSKINYVLPKNAQSLLASPATAAASPHSPATARIIKVRSSVPFVNRGGSPVPLGPANGQTLGLSNIAGTNRTIVKQTSVPRRVVSLQQLTQNGQKITINSQGQLVQSPNVIVSSQRSFITNPATSLTPQGKILNGKKIIIRSSSPGALSAALPTVVQEHLQRSGSPVTILGQNGLSGGHLISKTGRNSPTILHTNSQSSVIPSSSSSPAINGTSLKTSVSNKDLSRMWSNEDIKLKNLTSLSQSSNSKPNHTRIPQVPAMAMEEEEVEEEVEELGHAETYNEYMPTKLDVGEKHPDPVVETSSLASVEPPDVSYKMSLSETIIDCCLLSALQLESVTYASQRHEMILQSGERAGYLIGDGAGVGKGRTLAGIIFENYLLGRKRAIWLSVSNDLRIDAERDLHDIGAGKIDVHPLNKLKYAKISSKENGSIKKGVIFSTYSSLIGESTSEVKYKTRLKQLLKWCGKDFDGVIVFDECHKAKNLCPVGSTKPTKTGQTVLELQNRLPKARVVYASATGASEPKNMAYMTRLGLWGPGTPFKEFNDFIQAVEKRGVGAMELVAMDMKLRGMYIARQLSFHGVTFKIEEIPLSKDYKRMYNDAVKVWVEAREKFQRASELIQAEQRMRKSMWGQFWSSHQRFFKYLCLSAKVGYCVSLAKEAVRTGKCCVIGLQSTGEARTLEQVEEAGGELNDFVSTAKGVLQTLVEKHFPAPDRKKTLDLFGFGSYMYNNNSRDSTLSAKKRKIETTNCQSAKKPKKYSSSDGSDSDPSNSDFSDLNLSSASDFSSDDNPFGLHGSDSDDDPWLKKSMKKQKEKKKKKPKEKKKKKKKSSGKDKEDSDEEDEEFDRALAAAGLLKRNSDTPTVNPTPSHVNEADAVEMAFKMKRELLEKVEILGEKLPPNTLDHLIDELGGPENVAEMTGRKGRVVSTEDGVSYESRSETDVPLEILNLTEKQRFMDGEKLVAVISEAASSGISLQADRRVNNQRRRVHITLELPWSADRAVQQFGRTHRSNQVSSPEYVFLISDLAGEQRFASTVAKRLEALGALTHGDRRATESRDLSRFNIDNKYGRTALDAVMKSIANYEAPLVSAPKNFSGDFFEDVKQGLVGVGMLTIDERVKMPVLEKDYNNISKFLNRILGMEVEVQNALFQYFSSTLTSIVLEAKRSGRWDLGILDLGSGGESVKKVETKTFLGNEVENIHKTELTTVSVERGMSWMKAMDLWRQYSGTDDGFYISLNEKTYRKTVILAVVTSNSRRNKEKEKLFSIYKPNTGLQVKLETLTELKNKYKKILPDIAERCWTSQYDLSAVQCSHKFWKGSCRKVNLGLTCEIGLRTRTYHILSGSVLSVWSKVESVLASQPGGASSKMQIIRLKTDAGQRIVGSLIPNNCVKALTSILSQDCKKTLTEKHSFPEENEACLSMPMLW